MTAKNWVVLDPEDGFSYCETEAQALAAAQKAIDDYLDDIEWASGVEGVCVAQVTHCSTEVDRVERPEVLDDYGTDEEGNHWQQHWQYQCNYRMKAVEPLSAWIPVSEKVPGPFRMVLGHVIKSSLLIADDTMIDIVWHDGAQWCHWHLSHRGNELPATVTHWMELPDVPDAGKEGCGE